MDDTPSLTDDAHVFALAGLAGSGKSTAAEMIRDELQCRMERAVHTEVSDFCRSLYEAQMDGEVDDNDLGRWTAQLKERHGNDYILREMSKTLDVSARPHLVISGLRSPEEAEAVRDVFGADDVTVLSIWTLPDIRFQRKYGEVPTEEHEKWDEFCERNERETWDWNCVDFFVDGGPSDYIIANNGDEFHLERRVSSIARHETGGQSLTSHVLTQSPLPEGDRERIGSYL